MPDPEVFVHCFEFCIFYCQLAVKTKDLFVLVFSMHEASFVKDPTLFLKRILKIISFK